VNSLWHVFADELARWRDAGRTAQFWWRDDDAHMPTPALARLLALRAEAEVPLALAVVPARAAPALFEGIGAKISVLQHGADHANRAQPGEKKTEFSVFEATDAALSRLRAGQARLADLSGGRALPVLVPPWNRIPEPLTAAIGRAGFRGLSTFGTHAACVPGIRQVNTHLDIIAWRNGRAFAGEEQLLRQAIIELAARRTDATKSTAPLGWLTHHAVHDAAAWRFLRQLLAIVRGTGGATWTGAEQIFTQPSP